MKPTTSDTKLAKYLSLLIVVILALIPFHAFLTVWLASSLGHYTAFRLWKEFLLAVLSAGAVYLLVRDRKLLDRFLAWHLSRLIMVYIVVSAIWGAFAYFLNGVTLKALGYGLVVNLRFLIFFLAVWTIAAKAPALRQVWSKLLLWPALAVIIFGILQRLVLPLDFLKHFGYGPNTIYPYETINHNTNYPRVMSTLRGANPLGAYLNLIISVAVVLFIKAKSRIIWLVFGLAALACLFFSYSREAWLGAVLSIVLLTLLSLPNRLKKLAAIGLGLIVLIAGGLSLELRHNPTFENLVLHTQNGSAAKVSSNQQHVSAFQSGVKDVVHNPIGGSVGTAGPASVYNNGKTRIAENYFIQIAQENGWLGLSLFIAINLVVVKELWLRRDDSLSLALLASLAGLSLINMFSHAWTDDTLAYLWWGLAGIAIASPAILKTGIKNGRKNKKSS